MKGATMEICQDHLSRLRSILESLMSRNNCVALNIHIVGQQTGALRSVKGHYSEFHGITHVYDFIRPLKMRRFLLALDGADSRIRRELPRASKAKEYSELLEILTMQICCFIMTLEFSKFASLNELISINWAIVGKYGRQASKGMAMDLASVVRDFFQKNNMPVEVKLLQWPNTKEPPKIVVF